jgi:hypothetical protein
MLRCIILQDNQGHECISPDNRPDGKPIPTPRSRKRNLNQDEKGQVKDNVGPLPLSMRIYPRNQTFLVIHYYSVIFISFYRQH